MTKYAKLGDKSPALFVAIFNEECAFGTLIYLHANFLPN